MTDPVGKVVQDAGMTLGDAIQARFSDEEKTARVAKADEAKKQAAQLTNTPSKVLLRWLAKLGAGIVAGLGLAGVVGLIGSAVLWQRFDEAGLPPTQSLLAVPEGQRLIEGASGVASALLIGALAVAVLFSLDRTGTINVWSRIGLGLLVSGGVVYAVWGTELPTGAVVVLAILGLVLVGVSVGIGKVTGAQYVPFAFAVFASRGRCRPPWCSPTSFLRTNPRATS